MVFATLRENSTGLQIKLDKFDGICDIFFPGMNKAS